MRDDDILSRSQPEQLRRFVLQFGIRPEDVSIRPRKQIGDYADEAYRKRALRILATFKKGKPDKGKKWIAQEDHDRVLYGELQE